jgi:hypothetical protein
MARITKRDRFAELRLVAEAEGRTDLVEFVDAEVALLDKRSTAGRKPTKVQLANEALKADIIVILEGADGTADGGTATEVAGVLGVSVQKASQLLKQLVDAGLVNRADGKGKVKTLFTVA